MPQQKPVLPKASAADVAARKFVLGQCSVAEYLAAKRAAKKTKR
jgi:hypothetical protein